MKKKTSHNEEGLLTRLQSMNEKLTFLHEISLEISEMKPLPDLLNDIMENSKQLMQAEASSLLLYDPIDGKLHFHVATGEKGELIKQYSMDIGEGIGGWVAEHRQSLMIDDCYQDSRFNPEYDKRSNFKTRSMICVPMIRKGKLIGVIEVINKTGTDVFDEDDLSLFETLAAQCAIAIENYHLTQKQIEAEALERELDTARKIQDELIPKAMPPLAGLDLAPLILPAYQVGGDYYNVIPISENETLFVLADVSGKSISAALIVSTIDACLKCYMKIHTESFDLLDLTRTMNRVLVESTTEMQFATCWMGFYRHDSGEMSSINAGHNPPYLLKQGEKEIVSLNTGGLFLGGMEVPYQSEIIHLYSGDVLVAYTDGVTEAWNDREELYGDDRFLEVLQENKVKTADDILKAVEIDVNRYVGNAPQSDDFTCMVMKKQ